MPQEFREMNVWWKCHIKIETLWKPVKDRQTYRQTHRQTDRQTERHRDRQTEIHGLLSLFAVTKNCSIMMVLVSWVHINHNPQIMRQNDQTNKYPAQETVIEQTTWKYMLPLASRNVFFNDQSNGRSFQASFIGTLSYSYQMWGEFAQRVHQYHNDSYWTFL